MSMGLKKRRWRHKTSCQAASSGFDETPVAFFFNRDRLTNSMGGYRGDCVYCTGAGDECALSG